MAEVSVTILGLGRLGASVCLALKRYNNKTNIANTFSITAFSTDAEQVKLAKEADLAHRFVSNASDAIRGADIVVLTLAAGEVDGLLAYTAQDFRAGAVLFDLSRYKTPINRSAARHLHDEVHYVGLTPILNPKYLFDTVNDTTKLMSVENTTTQANCPMMLPTMPPNKASGTNTTSPTIRLRACCMKITVSLPKS